MSTYFSDSLLLFENRWLEIETLTLAALKSKKDIATYDSICRAIVVLMVAHFEGTIRDTAHAIINDLNVNSKFSRLPIAMKRVYCREIIAGPEEKEGKDLELRTQKAISIFDSLSPQIESKTYLRDGKNPSPTIIHRIANNFGIKDFFKIIDKSSFDIVFMNERRKIGQFKRRIKEHLIKSTTIFPYSIKTKRVLLNNDKKSPSPTLWEDFVDNLLLTRHGIAHGSNTENSKSLDELKEIEIKLEILEYAFMYVMCVHLIESME